MKPKSKKLVSVPKLDSVKKCLPRKPLPSMPLWLVHWHNCASSDGGRALIDKRNRMCFPNRFSIT